MNTIRAVSTASLSVFVVLAGAACARPETTGAANPAPGTAPNMGVTSAQNAADMKVIDQLTNARCDHAQSCNDIGQGQKYASRDLCVQQNRASTANDLNAANCPRGIEQGNLDKCTAAIQKQPCGVSLAALSTIFECRTDALCMK